MKAMIRIGTIALLVGLASGPALAQVQQTFPGVPPPVPSPPPLALPSPGLTRPPPSVVRPMPAPSFNDRVINCNLAFPNARGLGNNPKDRDAFVRHCVN